MWYATRASGYTALLLLSATVAVGLVTSMRRSGRNWPKFVVQSVHRDLSLLVVVFLVVHIATSVLDPFAKLTVLDAVVPFIASYRPLWLGLGVVSIELLIAITATSLVRHRLSWRAWRVVHMLAYISWPIAVIHGIGTGTDTKSVWALLLVTACVAAVIGALVWRLAQVGPPFKALGWVGIAAGLSGTGVLIAWMAIGPLQPGWAKAAGTPADLLAGATTHTVSSSPSPSPGALAVGLDDAVRGVLARSQASVTATMVDTRDASAQGCRCRECRRFRTPLDVPRRDIALRRACVDRHQRSDRAVRNRERHAATRHERYGDQRHAHNAPGAGGTVMAAVNAMQRLIPDVRDVEDLDAHLASFGPRPAVEPTALLQALDDSGLRGRGGADFPTGTKWRAVSNHTQGANAVVIANAAEREPASDKDRTLIALRPHLVLDGLEHAAETVGARRAIVYTSRADDETRRILQTAIAERRRSVDTRVFIEVVSGPNRYVAGEETALIARVSGRLARPHVVPPRPYQSGVDGKPTLVQNVETLAHAALIARRGAAWFRSAGTARTPGTMLLSVMGVVGGPEVLEADGTETIGGIVERAGGVVGEPSAVLIGGYSGRWVTAPAIWNVPVDRDALRAAGASIGAGVIAVLPADACGVSETDRVLTYLAKESAKQCGPCQFGLAALADTFHRVSTGRARPAALDQLTRWSADVLGRGACRHPDGTSQFVLSAVKVFGADLRSHLRNGACRYSDRSPLLPIPETEAGWW